jgi:hypothetical protein
MKSLMSILAVLTMLSCLSGCGDRGPKLYRVSGTVTYDGQPIPDGEIRFSPLSGQGRPDSGKIVAGQYELKVTAGEKKIKIFAASNDPALVGPPPPDMPKGGVNPPRDYIPDKYNVNSELTVIVEPTNGQTFPFELSK